MLQPAEYVALLFTKRAELKALKHLDKASRDRLFCILSVRPWPNAKNLSAINERIADATSGYRYGCDLDQAKRGKVALEPVASEFEALFDETGGHKNYYDFVESVSERVPVLQFSSELDATLIPQMDRIDALHRGIIVRVTKNSAIWLDSILSSGRLIVDDTLFVIDAEWSRDVLSQEMWLSGQIEKIVAWNETSDIVTMSSSFPNSFSHIDKAGTFTIDDRDLFNRLKLRHNAARLIYGDWGSTRFSEEQGGGTHYDRIDTARSLDWISYRQTGDDVGYKVLADRAKADGAWATFPDCWGKNSIDCTALDIPGRIVGTESAIAARVNMHLTAQAKQGVIVPPLDEPYVDPF